MKRSERGLNGTNQQVFEFFLSWDLREQLDFVTFKLYNPFIFTLFKTYKEGGIKFNP